jgi:membrane protein DedA with SNARE-associated domain
MEWLEHIIAQYGYLALFLGTFLEGETILLLAGFLAHSGSLDLQWCIVTAFAGSLSGDQFAFYIGRFKGKAFVAKRPAWQDRVNRVHQMLERFHEVLILSFRFFYGLRNLTPFILGTTHISGLKFFCLNAIGAALWAVIFACAGYFFGTMVATVMKDVHNVELILLVVALGLASAWWLIKRLRGRKKTVHPGVPDPESIQKSEDNEK